MPPSESSESKSSFLHELWELVRVLLISLIVVIPIRVFIAQPFIVKGASMEPNFRNGEYLIVDQLSFRWRDPARGEVIILRYPLNNSVFYIKRVVGLPGETVIIRDGGIRVRRDEGEETVLNELYVRHGVTTAPDSIVTLADDEFFVLGDNRADSSDSRVWGVLKRGFIVGRTLVRLWPLTKIGLL